MTTANDQRRVLKVSELTRWIKSTLERQVGNVWVEGELSNVRRPASGHYYFTIKDESSQIAAVLFRGSQQGLSFQPRDGLQVRAWGRISVYERSGHYQIIIGQLEEAGQGDLHARFEKLKAKLAEEGLFDESRKRPLPMLPRHIGVVTSDTGAAIRDILNVISRRFPNLHVVLAPARVQGEGAAQEIAEAIERLNRHGGLDALIVGRGGGSLEDLWCFNEEVVARAIGRSAIPVISAVGHEIDFTISDFVADVRAPTPSAAAELVVNRKDALEENLVGKARTLKRLLEHALLRARSRLQAVAGHYVFREPRNLVRQYQQQLDSCNMRMEHEWRHATQNARQRLQATALRLEHQLHIGIRDGKRDLADTSSRMQLALTRRLQNRRRDLSALERQLRALSPLAVLGRGYSLTRNAEGTIVRSVGELEPGVEVTTRVADGSFAATVEEVSRSEESVPRDE